MRQLLLALLLLATGLPAAADTVIHREKSLYTNIVVKQSGDRRCLAFSVRRQHRNQTCMDTTDPKRVVFPYVRMTFAALLVNPQPRRALMIGLGGGTISNVLIDIYPDLEIDLVEVDEAVVKVAREYFEFQETENTHVHIVDGRVFVRRAVVNEEKYDLVILDAFTGEYIPEHLMTLEFLEDVRSVLTDDGVAVANTFAVSELYDHESVTYSQVFGPFLNLKMPGTGNRVIVTSQAGLPDNDTLLGNANKLNPLFEAYDVNLRSFIDNLDRTPDWNTRKRPLTDQFSPANLLRNR